MLNLAGTRSYRPDIDGLRAISLLVVVFFHSYVDLFSGGFVGVDVFFVISGYLITKIIFREIRDGTFSLIDFYDRRLRRIIPPLFFISLTFTVAGLFIFLPDDLSNFGLALAAMSVFISNILFAHQESYFSSSNNFFLHSWSICLEEQFYFLFPLLLIITRNWKTSRVATFLIFTIIASLALAEVMIDNSPWRAFYMLPTRTWEFAIGAILAIGIFPKIKSAWLCNAGILVGLLMIIGASIYFDSTWRFPGMFALFPCIGAALIIHSGNGGGLTGLLLGSRPLVFLGRISYSVYLWHWPMMVSLSYLADHRLSFFARLSIVFASILIGALSWRYIELPFRSRRIIPDPKRLLIIAASGLAMLACIGWGLHWSNGLPTRLPAIALEYDLTRLGAGSTIPDCEMNDRAIRGRAKSGEYCILGNSATEPTWALWGDSHARSIAPAINFLGKENKKGVALFNLHSCPALLDVNTTFFPNGLCNTHNTTVLKKIIESEKLKNIVIASRYSMFINGTTFSGGAGQHATALLQNINGSRVNFHERIDLFATSMRKLVFELTSAGKIVFLIYPIPEAQVAVPRTLATQAWHTGKIAEFHIPRREYQTLNRDILPVLDSLTPQPPGQLQRIYPTEKLCNDQFCTTVINGNVLYRDSNHLTASAAELVISDLGQAMLDSE